MKTLSSFLICFALLVSSAWADDSALAEVFRHEQVLGTSMELKVSGASPEQAVKAEAAALAEIDRLAKILSSYDQESEVSRWLHTHDEAVPVSAELGRVLGLFDEWRTQTGGALDPAAAAVAQAWREAEARRDTPSAEALASAVAAVAGKHWQLNGDASRATHLSRTPLVFNSLTKAFIIERAAAAAMAAAAPAGIVLNIGGDIVVRGRVGEVVTIADPVANADNAPALDQLIVTGGAVATSGSYRRGFDIQGRHYSHIVDPRTGQTANAILSATVVAPDATTAGAMATAMCVLTPDESAQLAAKNPGAHYLIITREGQRIYSPGWDQLPRPAARIAGSNSLSHLLAASLLLVALPAPAPVATWDDSMELVISLELNRVQDPRYRRPYVAVWIEDKDKFPVRTLALWYQKPRWLPDLKGWSRSDGLRKLVDGTDLATTISSATRAAGQYTLKWDGKDDKGVPVKPGKYTVMIEAAREHGTYQLMKREIDFGSTPVQVKLEGNTEIAGATLDYRRKAGL